MKYIKRILLLILVIIAIVVYINYPKLNLISGYSAKSTASSVFLGKRDLAFTDSTDNNFGPVNLADDDVNIQENTASASVFGLKKRIAVYRDGLGSVLIPEDESEITFDLKPKRYAFPQDTLPYPIGNNIPQDSIFTNIDYDALNATISNSFDKTGETEKQTRSVLVLYKDHLIAEQYADGFDKESLLLGWSMTKSILSTLYGILQTQGTINIYDPAPIDEWKNDERSEITINDLLQMNSGLEWDEDYAQISDVTKMLFLEPDMTLPQRLKKAKYEPGTYWNYSSGTSNLLSGILKDQFNSHQEYLDFPYKTLIDRIGMHSMLIEADATGHYVMSSYAWATTRDWAKFGLLYLNKGKWNDEYIFDGKWPLYVSSSAPGSEDRYGGHFWLNKGKYLPDVPEDVYYADGFQGQRVFIIPSKDMVVVRMGLRNIDFNDFLKGIMESVK